jgi:two-component system nitrogen regulation sensor histidine kinase NtrY
MDAVTEPIAEAAPRKRRLSVTPAVEAGVLFAAFAIAIISYFVISGGVSNRSGDFSPLITK